MAGGVDGNRYGSGAYLGGTLCDAATGEVAGGADMCR
jgi:hypothetical protein